MTRRFSIRSIDDALRLADEWGITVQWWMPTSQGASDRRRGEYHHDSKQITIRPGMTAKQVLCTLTHELAHAYYGDGISSPSREARAWDWAARVLVDPDAYAHAEQVVGPHPGALAVELSVTVPVIVAWQRSARITNPTKRK